MRDLILSPIMHFIVTGLGKKKSGFYFDLHAMDVLSDS